MPKSAKVRLKDLATGLFSHSTRLILEHFYLRGLSRQLPVLAFWCIEGTVLFKKTLGLCKALPPLCLFLLLFYYYLGVPNLFFLNCSCFDLALFKLS